MRRSRALTAVFLFALPTLTLAISLFIGRYSASPRTVIELLLSKTLGIGDQTWPRTLEAAILQVRLPRVMLALLVGASLSVSGASLQGLYRNPLVSAHVLGVANGAAFGAALAILLAAPFAGVQLSAFLFGLLAVAITYAISRIYQGSSTLTMVLAGMIVASFFSALVSLAKYMADPLERLPAITFWLMGSLASASMRDLRLALPPMLLGMGGLLAVRWRINVLSMGEEEAQAMGVDTRVWGAFIVVCSTLATAAAVCVSGVVGFVGVVIPHIARILVGPDHKALLPASIVLGSAYFLIMDDLARSLTTGEIPLSILTGLIGTPIFAYLLLRGSGWS